MSRKLKDCIDFDGLQIAWVGSGGKTTLMFTIARQLLTKCVLTTTTHLAKTEQKLADQMILFEKQKVYDDETLASIIGEGLTLICGGISIENTEKLDPLTEQQLESISNYCRKNGITLMIEADGSRQKPIKAPANHEPAIPIFIDMVCVVIGIKAIGKPATTDNIHRLKIFSEVTGIIENEVITEEHIFKYLTHPLGGLKNILPGTKTILFLNQADTWLWGNTLYHYGKKFKHHFSQTIISYTNSIEQDITILASFTKIGCVILAAGEAKRFGSPKQLAKWNGLTLIEHVIQNARKADLNPLLVVTGAYHNELETILQANKIEFKFNPDWSSGQASSVRVGVQHFSQSTKAIIFLLVDQPQIPKDLIIDLEIEFAKSGERIIAYSFHNQIRHPVLFSSELFEEMSNLVGSSGGRQLFSLYPPRTIELLNPFHAKDIDSEDDLRSFDL